MKTRKVIVNDAASFVLAFNAPESTVEVFPQRNVTLNLDQVFSDAPAIEGILAAHHFHVHYGASATVAYPLSKDLPATGTGSDEKETYEVGASEMNEMGQMKPLT